MEASKGALQALVDIFVSPNAAFAAIEKNRKWLWLPLILVISSAIGLWLWYFAVVDFEWYQEHTLAAAGQDLSAEEMEAARKFMQKGTMIGTTVGAISVFVVLLTLIQAGYFHIVAKVAGDKQHSYGDWFNFSAWAGMPGIISVVAGVVVLLTAGTNQIPQESMQPLSLNGLLFNYPLSHPWASLLSSINLPMLWVIGLLGIGLAQWSKRSLGKSVAIAAAPFVVVFGIWAALTTLN